jgi:hypothetical protein
MYSSDMTVAGFDPELAEAISNERRRQEQHIELIASENYASPRVLEMQGSVLTNKYAEFSRIRGRVPTWRCLWRSLSRVIPCWGSVSITVGI